MNLFGTELEWDKKQKFIWSRNVDCWWITVQIRYVWNENMYNKNKINAVRSIKISIRLRCPAVHHEIEYKKLHEKLPASTYLFNQWQFAISKHNPMAVYMIIPKSFNWFDNFGKIFYISNNFENNSRFLLLLKPFSHHFVRITCDINK